MTSVAFSGGADLPSTVVTPPAGLAHARERTNARDPRMQPALDAVLKDASAALEQGPVSVTQNGLIPPSGDKHDYSSVGPYWWPNPKTADGLPYIRKDGQAIPGRCEGRGIGIIDTVCLIDLVDRIGLLKTCSHWSAEDHDAIVKWFSDYLDWLLNSRHGKTEGRTKNNHGSWYDAQVVAFAVFTDRSELATQVLTAARAKRIAKHIEPDGRQPHELDRTKSWGYSIYNLSSLVTLALLGERAGVDLWTYKADRGQGIGTALDYLLHYRDPESKWPHRQISKRKETDLVNLLFKAAHGLGEDRYRNALEAMPDSTVRESESALLYPLAEM